MNKISYTIMCTPTPIKTITNFEKRNKSKQMLWKKKETEDYWKQLINGKLT